MSISTREQETTISFLRDNDKAIVYTSDSTILTKLHKLVQKNPKEWKRIDEGKLNGDIVSETFECPKKLISFRTATPTMSEKQKQLAAEHLRKWMESKRYENVEDILVEQILHRPTRRCGALLT